MIKIENTEVFGWEAAIRGMRSPKNSWDKSDSFWCGGINCHFEMCPLWKSETCINNDVLFVVGNNDLALMKTLANAGTDHGKFMRFITVTADITAPLYWWKEYDTYKVGTVANSCSTMHKIHSKEFTLDDFSHEHLGVLIPADKNDGIECYQNLWEETLTEIVKRMNIARNYFICEKDPEIKKQYWWKMIQLLPCSYNQKRTVQLNYAVLRNMYHARKNHKLDCWIDFCEWIEGLPYAKELICNVD